MAMLVITTFKYQEAKALLKQLPEPNGVGATDEYREAYRKLAQAVMNANPLVKKNG